VQPKAVDRYLVVIRQTRHNRAQWNCLELVSISSPLDGRCAAFRQANLDRLEHVRRLAMTSPIGMGMMVKAMMDKTRGLNNRLERPRRTSVASDSENK
jgi:hypothetical protein